MADPDYDEDLFEEKSKLVYRRRSSTSQHDLFRQASLSQTDSDERSPEEPFRGHSDTRRSADRNSRRSSDRQGVGRRTSWSEMSRKTDPIRSEVVHRSPSFEGFIKAEPYYSDKDGIVEIKKVRKMWSYKSVRERKDDDTSYGRSADRSSRGGRDDSSVKASTVKTEDTGYKSSLTPAEQHAYCPVAKWDVDYTNQNYVRSKCNKPTGLHRYTLGREFKWDVDYDNTHYLRSKVNAPKGLHRRSKEVKRKRVPDNDDLGDSTGWEFEYGPEFLQVEEDVPYMPDERVVGRGAFRSYGVRRSCSDTDMKDEEKRQKIPGLIEDEFKYGPEFLQDDVQHTLKQKNGVIGRGAYRFYDADRSKCDKKPCDMMGIDYRESRTATDQQDIEDDEDEQGDRKGKPFKRTVLKKIVKLSERPSNEKLFGHDTFKYGTHLKFVPGMGSRSLYEGAPKKLGDRDSDLRVTKHPSIRSVFKKTSKTSNYSRHGDGEEGFNSEKKYSHTRYWDTDTSEHVYGALDHCNLCDRKEIPGKVPRTPERHYEREMPKRERRPKAQSLTSYESCALCDRKEMPGRQKRPINLSDERCDMCEKRKSGKGKRISPDSRGSAHPRGSAYSDRGYSRKSQPQKAPERSHSSCDSCDLCDKPSVPRVATPKRMVESKTVKASPIRDNYKQKTIRPSPSYERRYERTKIYDKKRKTTSPRENYAPEGDRFHQWKEMEKGETRPLQMTGSITQRRPRNVRNELENVKHYPRFHDQYAYPVEMMDDDDDFDDEEMMEEMPSSIENRINEIRKEISETRFTHEKGSPKGHSFSTPKRRTPKEQEHDDHYGRFQDEYVYSGIMMDEDEFDEEEMLKEAPSVEKRINKIRKKISDTCVPYEKGDGKGYPKRLSPSDSRRRLPKAPKEQKHRENYGRFQDKDVYAEVGMDSPKRRSPSDSRRHAQKAPKEQKQREKYGRFQDKDVYSEEGMSDDHEMSSEEFVPHVESTIKIVKKTISKTSFPSGKRKTSPKRIDEPASLNRPTDDRRKRKTKDHLKIPHETDSYSRRMKENGKVPEKFPSSSGSRIRTLAKKQSPTKLPVVKGKSPREYSDENLAEFSDSDEIDFEAHKNHPKDHGKSFQDGYEKYVSKNGSEIWIKSEERYSELYHIP